MKKTWINCIQRRVSHFFLLIAAVFSFVSTCNALDCSTYSTTARQRCELKRTYTLDVTTNNSGTIKHWYVSNDSTLHSFVVCDGGTSANYAAYNPCDPDSDHDNYYSSDDLGADSTVNAVDKDFTIKASAASYGTTMKNVRIEWQNSGVNPPSSWTSARSRTCTGGSCTICREGGTCANKDIYAEEISTKADGSQNVLWFRVIVTDNAATPNTITTAWDSYLSGWTSGNVPPRLDKAYRFPVCNSSCDSSCDSNVAPTITASNVTDRCSSNLPYIFNWTNSSSDGQSEFMIEIIDQSTGLAVFSKSVASSSTSYTLNPEFLVGGGTLQPSKTYRWRVRVKDNNSTATCRKWSAWREGTFTTCCPNTAPTLTTSVVSPTSCAAPSNFNYTLKWTFSDTQSDTQASYQVQVIDTSNSTVVYDTNTVSGTASQLVLGASTYTLAANKTYSWQVRATDNHAGCPATSAWKSGGNLTTFAWPSVSFNMNCVSGSTCYFNTPIAFTSTSSASSPTYNWYVDGVLDSSHTSPLSKSWSSGASHSVYLSITDGYSHTCTSSTQTINLSCNNTAPTISNMGYVAPSYCPGTGFPYGFNWTFGDADSGDTQASYQIKVRDNSSGSVVYDSGSISGAVSSFTIPQPAATNNFSAGKTYSWQVTVTDNHAGCPKQTVSGWSNLPTTYVRPTADFSILCSGGNCYYGQTVTFDGATSTYTGTPTYHWTIKGANSTTSGSTTSTFVPGDSATVSMYVTDVNGSSCNTASKTVSLSASPCSSGLSLSKATNVHTGDNITASSWTSGSMVPPTQAPVAYHWQLNGAAYNPANMLSTDTYNFSAPGSYKIGVYATDGWGRTCTAADQTISVTELDQCTTSFTLDKNSVRYGDTITMSGNASSNSVNPVYEWTVVEEESGDVVGNWTAAPPTTFTFPESDDASITYNIKLHVSDSDGRSCDASDKVVLATKRSPRWNETTPNLTPVQLIIAALLLRITLLRF